MKRQDWPQGAENEASSSNDPRWAAETHLYLRHLRRHQATTQFGVALLTAAALAALWMTASVSVARFWSPNLNQEWTLVSSAPLWPFDLVVLTFTVSSAMVLGRLGVRPGRVAPAFALVPYFVWLIGAAVVVPTDMSAFGVSRTVDLASGQLQGGGVLWAAGSALFGFLGASVGQRLRAGRARRDA